MTKMNRDQQNCPSMAPLVVIVVLLIIVIVGLIIWIFFLLRRECPKCETPPITELPPVLLYGFAPGVSSREITSSDGVLTPTNGELSVTQLNQSNPVNQQWQMIQTAPNQLILQHRLSEKYVGRMGENQVKLTSNRANAFPFNLVGPSRNGRVYKLKSGKLYLATAGDRSVGLMNVEGATPLNTEWIIALGTCQATGNSNCTT